MSIPQFCEIAMLCLFGCSWPFNIAKSLRAKTAKGKSVVFELLVLVGYFIGLSIASTPDGIAWQREDRFLPFRDPSVNLS